MNTTAEPKRILNFAWGILVVLGVSLIVFAPLALEMRALALCGLALLLWLLELTPSFVPTLVLLFLAPLTLDMPEARLPALLHTGADPVLLLFFSGFCLAIGTHKSGADRFLMRVAFRWSGGSPWKLTVAMSVLTAVLSMWMSNVAAAALMYAALGATLNAWPPAQRARLLVAIAMAASVGGMSTPIGTGPNAIALAEAAPYMRITFVHWMAFSLPLAAFLLAVIVVLSRAQAAGLTPASSESSLSPKLDYRLIGLAALTVAAWLSEPLHGVSAAVVGAGACCALFLSGVLDKDDLSHVDWSTLLLVAGGLMMGNLLKGSGLLHDAIAFGNLAEMPPLARDLLLVAAAALLSALMSNTATAAILIPIAGELTPSAASAVLVAIGTSLGMPFIISTPPNAMAHAHGASSRDLLRVGLPVTIIGVVLVGLTGRAFLNWIGIP